MLIFGDEQVGGLVKWYPATTISGRARSILDASGNPRRSAEGSFQAAVDFCAARVAQNFSRSRELLLLSRHGGLAHGVRGDKFARGNATHDEVPPIPRPPTTARLRRPRVLDAARRVPLAVGVDRERHLHPRRSALALRHARRLHGDHAPRRRAQTRRAHQTLPQGVRRVLGERGPHDVPQAAAEVPAAAQAVPARVARPALLRQRRLPAVVRVRGARAAVRPARRVAARDAGVHAAPRRAAAQRGAAVLDGADVSFVPARGEPRRGDRARRRPQPLVLPHAVRRRRAVVAPRLHRARRPRQIALHNRPTTATASSAPRSSRAPSAAARRSPTRRWRRRAPRTSGR